MVHKGFRRFLALFVSVLLLVAAVPAMAAQTTMSMDEAVALLRSYDLVRGDTNGDLRLEDTITRAEAATVFVRAMGKDSMADMLKDATPFADTKGHWAAGYVTLAYRLGLMKGRDDTTFDPNAKITNAEVLTVLLRLVEREPAGPWNAATIVQTAEQLGLVPQSPASAPAYRGGLFRSMAIALSSVQLSNGQTALQRYVDNVPPSVELANLPTTTNSETLTVSGTTKDAVSVTVNGQSSTMVGTQFSSAVTLGFGKNTITVVAKDAAGNVATKTAEISRAGQIATLVITGPDKVEMGKAITLTVAAKDAQGNTVAASGVTATSSLGTYDPATSTFTAGSAAGSGKITFTVGSVTKDYPISVLGPTTNVAGIRIQHTGTTLGLTAAKFQTVKVEMIDSDGAVVNYDQGRSVKLEANDPDVTITPSVATTVAGVATFTVLSTQVAEVQFTATSGTFTPDTVTAEFASSTRIVLIATPSSATADGSTPVSIRAALQDDTGAAVINNSSSDIDIDLSIDSDNSMITRQSMVIPRGSSSSVGNDGAIIPGVVTESVKVSGTITSVHTYTVVPVVVSFKGLTTGSANKFDITGSYGTYNPDTQTTPLNLTVRVTDGQGNVVPTGSYAFQIQVRTSNEEDLVNGVPEGLDLSLGTAGGTPILGADGAVVGRTVDGTASLQLTYNKSGKVYLKAVGVGTTADAISDEGDTGSALSSRGFATTERAVTYAGTPHHLKIAVDLPSAKLNNQPYGVLAANGSAAAKVKVYLVDSHDGWIPNINAGKAKLEKVTGTGDGTRLTGTTDGTETFSGGVAEFSVVANRTVDVDEWQASAATLLPGLTPLPTVKIITADAKPTQPQIDAIAGESGNPNRVTVDDDFMEIDFSSILGAYASDTYGYVKVYRSGSSTPIYTSDVVDLHSNAVVEVPKGSLPDSSDTYTIAVNNGYGDSVRSMAWPQDGTKVSNESPVTVDITSVQYDASDAKLYVKFSGSSGGEVDPGLLSIQNTQLHASYSLGSADCTVSSSSFTCTNVYLDPAEFQGTAVLMTEPGWYTKGSAGQAAEADNDLSNNLVAPMAYISYAVVTFGSETYSGTPRVTGTVTLFGKNLNQGRIYADHFTIRYGATEIPLTGAGSNTTSSSTTYTFNLPNYRNVSGYVEANSIAKKVKDATGPDITMDASEGWLTSSGYDNGALTDIPVYAKLDVTRVQYDVTNNQLIFTSANGGFLDGIVDTDGLVIMDRTSGVPVVQLDSTDTVAPSYVTGGKVNNDHEFRIQLTADQKTALTVTKNWDNLVWVSSTTGNGAVHWFTTAGNWYANELPHLTYRLNW